MSRPLVAVVPNFSEGRRRPVIDAILEALQVPGVLLVYRQWDPDHNRLDTTLVGTPEAVRRSALAGARVAAELIDMDQHHGSHPRMGAADVIPFMPVQGITMDECIALAREFAEELAGTLNLPVYLYDRAALTPERASLADVRKGEYEGLKAAVAAGERLPDFGPHHIGKAGAVAVGARKPLVAFNVYLAGGDEAAAKEIARAVRESSGGLAAVRAIGFEVPERGAVTVSMNLVDYEVTTPRRAFEAVRAEAERRGMTVIDSEIVGLVPREALGPGDEADLRLEGFDANEQILENLVTRLEAAEGTIGQKRVDEFLEALASSDPAPGGGSAAAVAGAAGAALVAMVGRLTAGKKGYEGVSARMDEVVKLADEARAEFLRLADTDADAFNQVVSAFRLPKDSDDEKASRSQAIQAATILAAEVPLDVAGACVRMMELAIEVVGSGNTNAVSDGAAGGHLLYAGTQAALANVAINVGSIKDADASARLRSAADALDARSRALVDATSAEFRRRLEGA
jgi:glutamate formiminotransferase / formiminotetrahydrofolate cyclodeaminase